MRHSLDTIARELGVSKTTVSLVLNGKAARYRVSQEMRQRILDHCKKINYAINIHAKRMNQELSKTIGILLYPGEMRNMSNPLGEENTANIVGGVMNMAMRHGYRFIIDIVGEDKGIDILDAMFSSKEIDGLVYYGFSLSATWMRRLKKIGHPLVAIGEGPSTAPATVNIDNFTASFELTNRLLREGRRSFRYLRGNGVSYPGNERYRGFREALRKSGIIYEDHPGDFARFRGGFARDWVRSGLASGTLSEKVIVCENDEMAIGVIKELHAHGVRMPEDIAVTGADDISVAGLITPSLTTFSNKATQLGEEAFVLLLRLITGEKLERPHVTLDSAVVWRESA